MEYKCFDSRNEYEKYFFDESDNGSAKNIMYHCASRPMFNTVEFPVWNMGVNIPHCENLIIYDLGMCWRALKSESTLTDVAVTVSANNYIYFNCESRDICLNVATYSSTKLQKIDLWGRVVEIRDYCCRELNKLREVHLAPNCIVIGEEAFYRCNKLVKVNFEELYNLIEIKKGAFQGTYINELLLPSCKKIGEDAFKGVRGLSRVYLPDGLEFAGDGCFMDCNSLTEIRIPSTLKELPTQFLNCGIFKEIEIPDGVRKIKRDCITGVKVRKLTIPKSVKLAMRYCLRNSSIEELYIPSDLYQDIFAEYDDVREYIGIREGEIIRY